MRHAWIWSAAALGCGPPPVATFSVVCADRDCTTALATADEPSDTTAFRWILDGTSVGTGPTLVHEGEPGTVEHLQLEATSVGGTATSEIWVMPNEAVALDATGAWEPVGAGFELVGGGTRTVDTECGPFSMITSIGGCFVAGSSYGIFLSQPTSDSATPPSPLSPVAWEAPATFVPGSPLPAVQRGGWDAARAWIGADDVSDGWDPANASISGDVPRFEAGFSPDSVTLGRWAVVVMPGPQTVFHSSALYLQCDADAFTVLGVPIEDRILGTWAADGVAL